MAAVERVASLSRLRMTPQDFLAYKTRQARFSHTGSYATDAHFCISGYDGEAQAAIKACGGNDTLRVKWSMNDCALDVMTRVEDLLRIPLQYWGLATEGALLDHSDPAPLTWRPSFQGSECVDLVLVPLHKTEDYIAQKLYPIWQHLRPDPAPEAGFVDSLDEALALYHLIDPMTSLQWHRYVQLRKATETEFHNTLRTTRHLRKLHPLMTQIREGLTFVLRDTALHEKEQLAFTDGIIPLTLNVSRSRNVTDVEICSRIHSPTKPAAVDVSYLYHHRVLQNHVEFYCHAYFKISDPISSADPNHTKATPCSQRWERLFEMGTYCETADRPPQRKWHPIVQTKWSLVPFQVGRVRAALFGAGDPASAVDNVDTVRLLLAAVGIPYRVARTEGEADGQDPLCARAIFWEWEDDDWIGLNVRRVCGVPLPRDGAWRRSTYYLRSWEDEDVEDATLEKWSLAEDTLIGEDSADGCHDKDTVYVSDDEDGSVGSHDSDDSDYSSKDTFGV